MANGNCKFVRCVTDGRLYASVTATAMVTGVSPSSISYAIKHKTKSKGKEYRFEDEMYRYGPKMGERISELTSENESLRAKARLWDEYQAKLEAARNAEEKRLAEEAKAKAKHEAEVAKLEAKVARLEAKYERKTLAVSKAMDEEHNAYMELSKAIEELNALNANETVEWTVM